jgi:hypothetical protein
MIDKNDRKNMLEIINENICLNIKCFKWFHKHNSRKYDEMFDYDTNNFNFSEFDVKSQAEIIDNFYNLKIISDPLLFQSNELETDKNLNKIESHERIIQKSRKFLWEPLQLDVIEGKETEKKFKIKYNKYTYIVCKYLDENSEFNILYSGSLIRIGKFFMKVMALRLDDNLKQNFHSSHFINSDDKVDSICRICFKSELENNLESETKDYLNGNELISVCNCKGSLKYIHISCLTQWIQSKIEINYEYLNPNIFKIKVKNFSCEICRKYFPIFVNSTYSNGPIFLLEFLKSKKNFIFFKTKIISDEMSIEKIEESKNIKNDEEEFLLIELNKYNKSISFGRESKHLNNKTTVVLDDISVSRKHCLIYYDEKINNLRIKDLGSKFGTLLSMPGDIIINHSKLVLQKGNTVYHMKMKYIK